MAHGHPNSEERNFSHSLKIISVHIMMCLQLSTWLTCKNSRITPQLQCFQSAIMEISTPANYYCPAVSRSIKSDRFKRWAPSPQTEAWQNVRNTGSIFSRLGRIRSSSNGEHNWIIGDSPTNREKKGKKHELFRFLPHDVAAKKLFVGDGLTPGFSPHLGTQPGFCEANASRHTCGLLENYIVGSIHICIHARIHT